MITEVITHRDCEVSVYVATDTIAQEEVALKLNTARHRFRCEAEFYDDSIRDLEGFPRMRWAWEHCFCYFTAIALDRLGPSLGALIKEVEESKFSLKTTLQIMNQVITRIQALHERHIIHRGIKPDNFCIGMPGSKTENTVYMIDFDHAKKFRDPLTHLHIPYREENDVGNSSQTSLGVHPWTSLAVDQRVEASRRDDMESAGYMAVAAYLGATGVTIVHHTQSTLKVRESMFPWKNMTRTLIFYSEKDTSLEYLCEGLPEELKTYISYSRSLKFDEEPDYDYCRGLFRRVFERERFKDDGVYDWTASEVELDMRENEPSPGSPQVSASGVDDTEVETTEDGPSASQTEVTQACSKPYMSLRSREVVLKV
ncbi:hypothetical protein I350_06723 [Cryptococcus amylolentus CBS 6273]|uniref:Protein kinase domain-containing protein n=1 Tax=Cryptococcus amylolentus CBS 6273 TaxID=1296118 RepID=A0A1E3JGZ6_9TREE|nr:hypothetical protein I350_06723 [Cryptococcus amylolentus CBS 6273]